MDHKDVIIPTKIRAISQCRDDSVTGRNRLRIERAQ